MSAPSNAPQEWFPAAGFGIFLHWGIYSVGGIEASWPFFMAQVPHAQYFALARRFDAQRFDAPAWARFFRDCGASYAVLTAKHHDGVALWPSEQPRALRIADISPSGARHPDLLGEFCNALRAQGLRVGIYFSHADWTHPDYPAIHNQGTPAAGINDYNRRYSYPPVGGSDDPERWERFLTFHRGQLRELCQWYSPDLLWFDGDWERSRDQWRMPELQALLRQWRPGIITNNRLCGLGDYLTYEQKLPEPGQSGPAAAWEVAETLNHQWAWSPDNSRLKSLDSLARLYTQIRQARPFPGNLLLNIGPRPDGTFDPPQSTRLAEFGHWIRRHDPAQVVSIPQPPIEFH